MENNNNLSFRLAAKHLFLTYPKCDLSPEKAKELLDDILQTWKLSSYFIVQEQHKDQDFHLHCYLQTKKKIEIKNSSKLDLIFNDTTFHGNYQAAKSKHHIIQYLLKQQPTNFIISSDIDTTIDTHKLSNDQLSIQMNTLAEQGKIKDALELLKEFRPAVYSRSHMQFAKSFKAMRAIALGANIKIPFNQFVIPHQLKVFLNKAKHDKYPKTLQIIGPPRIGKSLFIQAYLENEGFSIFRAYNLDGLRFYKERRRCYYLR